jgi:sugar transferase (PEP-CTERM system associated)
MRIRLFGRYVHMQIAALAAGEALIFFGALLLAFWVRFRTWHPTGIEGVKDALWPCAAVFSAALLVSLLAFGLYSSLQTASASGVLVRLMAGIANGTVVTAALFYSFPSLWLGRGVLGLAALFALLGAVLSRILFTRLVDRRAFRRRVLVYGVGQRTAAVSRLHRRADPRGFDIVGFVQPDGESVDVPSERVLKVHAGGLRELCETHHVDEIVVAMQDRRCGFPILGLLECRFAGIEVTDLLTFLERETGRVCIDVMHPSWMIFGEGFRRDPIRLFSHRALDLSASLLILVLFLPVMVLTGLAIKLEDSWRAPIFYRQVRVGLDGRTFNVLKFRSMRTDAESDGGAQWAQKSDPRVTRVGAVIRKVRIDELPQIVNVLRGQMSFVGPRPERPQFVKELAERIPYYLQRHCVKPGITGWAQLCHPYGASEEDAQQKLQYDLYYIKHNSLVFDLAILVQTAEVVFMGKGAR